MSEIKCDWVFYNANIITMDPGIESAEMLGIKGDKIVYVGRYNARILEKSERACDICRKAILPGFIDLHTHLWKVADVITIDLGNAKTYEEAVEKLEREVKLRNPGEWVFASNWDESKWKDRKEFLSKEDLDTIGPENPLFTRREDGHLASLNSLAIKNLPLSRSHPGIERDAQGNPTGILKDVWLDLTPYYKHLLPESIEKSAQIAASKGITAAVDNLTITPEGQKNILDSYFKLDLENKLSIRVFLNPTRETMQNFLNLGIIQNWGSSFLRFSGFKGFIDGAIGAQTALISEPYINSTDFGDNFMDEDELVSQIMIAEENNYTMCIHAIGDRAIERVIICYETGLNEVGKETSNRRHRIEHAEMINDSQIKKAKELGLVLSMQPNFLKWEYLGELYEQRLGSKRFMTLNRFATILKAGLNLHFGSDNMPLSPMYGIQQAVSFPSSEIQISIKDAIKAYTINNAHALFVESEMGSITPKKYADFIILSQSPYNVNYEDLNETLIEKTIVGGREVYNSGV